MVTTDRIRRAWEAIVTSHKADVAFISLWEPVLDAQPTKYPCCKWRPLSGADVTTGSDAIQNLFSVVMHFVDQTASDRDASERDVAHDRMDGIARMCWAKFHQLYVINSNTFQGAYLDFVKDAVPTYTPSWDATDKHVTGVTLEVTLRSNAPNICIDDYFNS